MIHELHALADVLLAEALHDLARLLEKGEYTYDTINEKRFVPDGDACEICEGDEDGPPLHPHCGCELEYRERRVRVYT